MTTILDIIQRKRDGEELTSEEIEYFIEKVSSGKMEQCQLGSFLMAVFFNGMSVEETASLTVAMMNSGSSFQWPKEWEGEIVDKHSTGGVGDKISLILTPALAACGLKVPMITGRGLGFSGGTLDKMESIPGFTVSCGMDWVEETVKNVGCCIAGQTEDIVPADRVMYAVRGITATVESIPLIVGSIISKKAVEKLSALVLDIKVGRAAFMTDYAKAKRLAEALVETAKRLGIKTVAVLSKMDSPIGRYIGNALEVAEAIYALHGQIDSDLKELVLTLGGHLLTMTGKVSDFDEGCRLLLSKIQDGSAMKKFKELIISQGVDENVATELCEPGSNVWSVLPKAKYISEITYHGEDGFIEEINARSLAEICLLLGTGRMNQQDSISYSAGLQLILHVGQEIHEGTPWLLIHSDNPVNTTIRKIANKALKVSRKPILAENLKRVINTVK